MPRTKKQVEEVQEESEINFEALEETPIDDPSKKRRSKKAKEEAPKKPRKEKYKPNPAFKIKEYCDIYLMFNAKDKAHEHLLLTFNPYFNNIYVSPNTVDDAIEEMMLYAKHKENKKPRIIYSKGDARKTENDWIS